MKKPGASSAERRAGKRLSGVVMLFYASAFLLRRRGGGLDDRLGRRRVYGRDRINRVEAPTADDDGHFAPFEEPRIML